METRRFDSVSLPSRCRLVAVSLPCLTAKRAQVVGGSRTENRETRTENRETARECRLYRWLLVLAGVRGG